MSKKPKYFRSTFTYNGKRYERKSPHSQREADRKADTLKAKLERGEVGVSCNMTVKAWAYEWLEVYKEPTIGYSQYKSYLGYINNSIIPAIGAKPIKDVKDVELQKIINSRAGNSKSDLRKMHITICAIFRRAHASGLIPKNPAEYLEVPAAKEGKRRKITDAERKHILKIAESHYAGLWLKLTLYCGLRPGESRALDWRHVDFENKLIHVTQSMKAKTTEIGEPKSKSGIRDIPIPDIFLPDLIAARGDAFSPVVVKEISKKRHTEKSMSQMWSGFKREMDITMGAKVYRNQIIISAVAPDLQPYCLRHTYCTDLEDKGVSINMAKYFMGHANISVTANIYTHTTPTAIQNAANLINKSNNENVAIDVAQKA